jgi:hypothetical protein
VLDGRVSKHVLNLWLQAGGGRGAEVIIWGSPYGGPPPPDYGGDLYGTALSTRPQETITVSRLPTVGGDIDQWGTVLNDYLQVSLGTDGKPKISGVDSVTADATSVAITFTSAFADTTYTISLTPNWNTAYWYTNKATTGITINFSNPAEASAEISWQAWP